MLTTLVRLRDALQRTTLPLELPGVAERRVSRVEMIDQLEDYVLPRLARIDAPLLTVVGGSTGAGKSTLVNSLVGTRVTAPGVLRPTTRSPVLVHNPADAGWFGQDRILPDLERTPNPTTDPNALQLVATTSLRRSPWATVSATSTARRIGSVIERVMANASAPPIVTAVASRPTMSLRVDSYCS
jgi:hypothetical protein